MIGTNPSGKGGVASVAALIINEGFLHKHNIRYVTSHENLGALNKALVFLRAFAVVLSQCITARPKIVHAHSSAHGSFIRKSVLLAIARLFGCKTIFHLHAGYFQHYATEDSNALMRWWIRHTLQKSSTVIALSNSWASFLNDYAPGIKAVVIPNSVKLPNTHDHALEEKYRILFLGDLSVKKGIFELFQAISLLKSSFPDIKLALGGLGDFDLLRAKAQELDIEANIEWLGWIAADKKSQELARASIFALPSHIEGLPMAMLEAMSAAKAVVVTPVGGIPEVIKDGENGLLVPVQDPTALALAFRQLFENRLLQTTIGEKARDTIANHYCTEVVLTALSAIYSELGVLS